MSTSSVVEHVEHVESPERGGDTAVGDRPRRVSWRQALLAGLVAFALWTFLEAPTLLRSAEASPLGARRSVAVAVLRPLAAVSRATGLSHLVGAADRVIGRDGPDVVQGASAAAPVRRADESVPQVLRPDRPEAKFLPPLPTPTAGAPLRVLCVGDSLGVDFGGPMAEDLTTTGVVSPVVDAHVDTGLSRPDYFNWPTELQADLAQYRPQAVVVFLGANDPQNLVEPGGDVDFGTAGWDAAYGARVGQFMSEATATGARVIWVGMPPMPDPGLSGQMHELDTVFQQQAALHPGVTYMSSWTVLGTPQGAFSEYLPDPSGAPVAVREPDGTHVSPAGAELLSRSVIADMDRSWGLSLTP